MMEIKRTWRGREPLVFYCSRRTSLSLAAAPRGYEILYTARRVAGFLSRGLGLPQRPAPSGPQNSSLFFVDDTRTQFTEESKMATALTPQTDVTL